VAFSLYHLRSSLPHTCSCTGGAVSRQRCWHRLGYTAVSHCSAHTAAGLRRSGRGLSRVLSRSWCGAAKRPRQEMPNFRIHLERLLHPYGRVGDGRCTEGTAPHAARTSPHSTSSLEGGGA
jgi:hypothetical protein